MPAPRAPPLDRGRVARILATLTVEQGKKKQTCEFVVEVSRFHAVERNDVLSVVNTNGHSFV